MDCAITGEASHAGLLCHPKHCQNQHELVYVHGAGCPNPRPSLAVLAQYGKAFTTAMDMADRQALLWSGLSLQEVAAQLDSPNITAASLAAINASVVADTLLGAMAAAGQSCSQPNTVTPGIQSAVVQK